jgi:hypothetical protein
LIDRNYALYLHTASIGVSIIPYRDEFARLSNLHESGLNSFRHICDKNDNTAYFSGAGMRIYDERYTRDLRRYDLAWRLIGHEARTETISRLTGFTPPQIRSFYRSYALQSGSRAQRLRGSAPRVLDSFFRSRPMLAEASAVAGWCAVLGLVPNNLLQQDKVDGSGLDHAEKLCSVFELYRDMSTGSRRLRLSIEHLLLLVTALCSGEKMLFESCGQCGADLLVEKSASAPRMCAFCRPPTGGAVEEMDGAASDQNVSREGAQQEFQAPSEDIQQSLF